MYSDLQYAEMLRPYQSKIDRIPGFTPKATEMLTRDMGIEDKAGALAVCLCLSSKNPVATLERHIAPSQRTVAFMALAERLERAPPFLFTSEVRGDKHPKEGQRPLSPQKEQARGASRGMSRGGGRSRSPTGGIMRGQSDVAPTRPKTTAGSYGGGGVQQGGGQWRETLVRLPPPELDLPPASQVEVARAGRALRGEKVSAIQQLYAEDKMRREGMRTPSQTPAISRTVSETQRRPEVPGDSLTREELDRGFYMNNLKPMEGRKLARGMHLGLEKVKVSAAGITLGTFEDEEERVGCFMVQDDGKLVSAFMKQLTRTRLKLADDGARGSRCSEELDDLFGRINPKMYPDEKEKKALLQKILQESISQREKRAEEDDPETPASKRCNLITLSDIQAAVKGLR